MFERELDRRRNAAAGELRSVSLMPVLGGLDRSLPNGDIEEQETSTEIFQEATKEVAMAKPQILQLLCDGCGVRFESEVSPDTDLFAIDPRRSSSEPVPAPPADFDPATAGALCPPCNQTMARLVVRKDSDPFPFHQFAKRVAESMARKLGIVPAAN